MHAAPRGMTLHKRGLGPFSRQNLAQIPSSPPPRAPCGIVHGTGRSGSRSDSTHYHTRQRRVISREWPLCRKKWNWIKDQSLSQSTVKVE